MSINRVLISIGIYKIFISIREKGGKSPTEQHREKQMNKKRKNKTVMCNYCSKYLKNDKILTTQKHVQVDLKLQPFSY